MSKYRDCATSNDFELYLMCCGVMLLLVIYIYIFLCANVYAYLYIKRLFFFYFGYILFVACYIVFPQN